MSTEQRRCWKCGNLYARQDRLCPDCGADSWNPPQGMTGTGGKPAPSLASPILSSSLSTSTPSSARYSTHPNVVAGITIMAILALLNVYFWIGIAIIGVINDPGFAGSYVSGGRTITAMVISGIATILTWAQVSGYYENEA
jgi:hypothetical protein